MTGQKRQPNGMWEKFSAKALVEKTDTFPYFSASKPDEYTQFRAKFWDFFVNDTQVGHVQESWVRNEMWPAAHWKIDNDARRLTLLPQTPELRTQAVQETLRGAVDAGLLPKPKGEWGGEMVPVVHDLSVFTGGIAKQEKLLEKSEEVGIDKNAGQMLDLDMVGLHVFSIVVAGVHLIAWHNGGKEGRDGQRLGGPEALYWVQKRSGKVKFPSMLDTTVCSNLLSNEKPIEKLRRAALEEANIPEDMLRPELGAKFVSCGPVSYAIGPSSNPDVPGFQHHVQFAYELELPGSFEPGAYTRGMSFPGHRTSTIPSVERFHEMPAGYIGFNLELGSFADWRAMTWIAHFIRHGIINESNEPFFAEVCARVHRDVRVPFL